MARYLNKGRKSLLSLIIILVAVYSAAGFVRICRGPGAAGMEPAGNFIEKKLIDDYFAGMNILSAYFAANDMQTDVFSDPNNTGFIGEEISEITTSVGSLISKRTSTNPEWVLWLYRTLVKLGIDGSDSVALNLSGSFPALNLASILAVEACGAEPVIISSVGASTWGANRVILTWPDMETLFYEAGLIKHRSIAASLGGDWDKGPNLFSDGKRIAAEAVRRNGIPLMEKNSLNESVKERYVLFNNKPASVFINVGGNHPALGACPHSLEFKSGLILQPMECDHEMKGLLHFFTDDGIPVIHLLNLVFLAEHEGIGVDPVPLPYSSRVKKLEKIAE